MQSTSPHCRWDLFFPYVIWEDSVVFCSARPLLEYDYTPDIKDFSRASYIFEAAESVAIIPFGRFVWCTRSKWERVSRPEDRNCSVLGNTLSSWESPRGNYPTMVCVNFHLLELREQTFRPAFHKIIGNRSSFSLLLFYFLGNLVISALIIADKLCRWLFTEDRVARLFDMFFFSHTYFTFLLFTRLQFAKGLCRPKLTSKKRSNAIEKINQPHGTPERSIVGVKENSLDKGLPTSSS